MNISILKFPAAIAEVSSLVAQIPLMSAVVSYTGVQACLRGLERISPAFYNAMQKAYYVFLTLDIASTIWTFGQLIRTLDVKFCILMYAEFDSFAFNSIGWGAMVGWIGLSILAVTMVNKYLTSKHDPDQVLRESIGANPADKGITIRYDRPLREKVTQWIYISRLVMTIGLVILTPGWGAAFFAVSAACQAYSLVKLSEWQWLRFDRLFVKEIHYIKSVALSYYCLLFPATMRQEKTAPEEEEGICAVCQTSEPKPDVHFCENHVFHETDIPGLLYSKSDKFLTGAGFHREEKHNYSNGKNFVEYTITLLPDHLPGCPLCRSTELVDNRVEATVYDRVYGPSTATVEIAQSEA